MASASARNKVLAAVASPINPSTGRAVFIFLIADVEDLNRLPRPQMFHMEARVEIALPHLTPSSKREFERRLADGIGACGCREGHVCLVAYIGIIGALTLSGLVEPRSTLAWLALLIGLVMSAFTGKAVGLAIARLRLRSTVAELRRAFDRQGVSATSVSTL